MTTIQTKYGYSVDCFGKCDEFKTIDACFDDEWYDGMIDGAYKNWREAVADISAYAERKGTMLVELESD